MNTPFELFGVEHSKGWHKLIKPLIEQCNKEDVKIFQIKEKFGELRFYIDGNASKELEVAIDAAEAASRVTCEYCGEPGVSRGGGWIKTLCDKCNEPRKE